MAGEPIESVDRRRKGWVDRIERALADLAGRQHGVVARRQLLDLGLGSSAIDRRLRAGRLHRIHHGVYAVGHRRLTRDGRWLAAVLAGGRGAVLSHRPAGAAWGVRRWSGRPAITVPGWRRPTSAFEVHGCSLPADEVTVDDGIPITTVPRTLLDLATVLDRDALARAVNEAEVDRLADPLSLPALLERHRGERGTGALRAVLEGVGYGLGVTRSPLEELFVRFLADRGLPHPELNAPVHVGDRFYEADCLWRAPRLIVELHGVRYHGTAQATTRDAGRDRRLLIEGWTVIHVTWAILHDRREAAALERDLRAVLNLPA